MISVKTDKNGKTEIHISGNNLLLFGELIAVVGAVSKSIFKDNDEDRKAMLIDLPRMVLLSDAAESSRIELPYSLEKLKNLGGEKEGPQL